MGIEFYSYNGEIWYNKGGVMSRLDEGSELVDEIINSIQSLYPEAYKALTSEYSKSVINPQYCKFLCAKRFCKCNFSLLDSTYIDISDGCMKFEKVQCPLRGECKYEGIICQPKISTALSEAELRVMEQVYHGKNVSEISTLLYISPNTVKNHIKSVYAKLGVHKVADFINYANSNNLFN